MQALFGDYQTIIKSGLFDPEYYLTTYPDVAERNVDPLVHFLEEGASEGRNPHPDFDAAFYLEQCNRRGEAPANPLLHYLLIGSALGLKTKPDGATGASARATSVPNAAAKPPMLVTVEALGVLGKPGGGSRVSIQGWALAAAPITDISAALDGVTVAKAAYGWARPDIGRVYPGRAGADRSGFLLAFDLPETTGGLVEPLLTVRTADGEVGRQTLRVEIPPQQIVSPFVGKELMQLGIDEVAVDRAGILRVGGWAVCLVQIESVEVFVDGIRLGEAEFGRVRNDLEKAAASYPNSRFAGFLFLGDVSRFGPGTKTAAVRVVARPGISRVATAEVEIPAPVMARSALAESTFHHHCDEIVLTRAGQIRLKGWAAGASPVAAIDVLLDGVEIGEAQLGIERPDIGNLLPALPHARQSGFAFSRETSLTADGEHLITLRLRRDTGQIHEIALPIVVDGDGARSDAVGGSATVGGAERRLHLDEPRLVDGAMETPVRGNLEIGGWALARAGVAAVEIAVDGAPVAAADYGVRRLDVRAAFPDWENALGSGFLALVPHRMLSNGAHRVSVTLRDKGGEVESLEFAIRVEELSDGSGPWSLRRRMPRAEIELGRRILESRRWQPAFQIVLPVGANGEKACTTIASLLAQVYPNWRLTIVLESAGIPPGNTRDRFAAELDRLADRVEIVRTLTLSSIPRAAAQHSVFLAVLTPGDELGCDALQEMAIATAIHTDADFLYSDERRLNLATGKTDAFFKPQWSPDLLLSMNYIGRLWCARAELVRSIAKPAEDLLSHGDYDLVLRCTEAAAAIRHVPAVLCEPAAMEAEEEVRSRAALARALERRGIAGEVRQGLVPVTYQLKRELAGEPLVSIIIPTRAAGGLIETCLETLRRVTVYPKFEIVCIENIPPEDRKWRDWLERNTDRLVSTDEPFNWSRFNNLAAREAEGEFLLFLNDDVEIVEPDWLDALIEQAQRPEVGAVGPLLLYPDGRIQHAGIFLAAMAQGRHAFRYTGPDEPGYFGLARTQRDVIAVTGACLMTRRETFLELGGFDEAHGVINNDLDYCLRVWRRGLVNVYTPHARLTHHEAASRAELTDAFDPAIFDGEWREVFLAGDPFFSPHLAKDRDDFSPDGEPNRLLVSGRPLLSRDEVRRILVTKLDHIGDCVIAFAAIRRLKRHFPNARISVLTSRASMAVWSLEPSVEETIEFDFFHARSALGQIELSEENWRELEQELPPRQFDLAVDLRKHPETRPVLQHSGARYLAGFDHRNLFPWLDIAIDWGGDQAFARKRHHTADDLVNLVDAIAAACEEDRQAIAAAPEETSPALAKLLKGAGQPLVCVHPTAGNEMKQWPIGYFAAMIDQLVEADGARITLVGGPDEEAVAGELLERLRHPEAVTSLIGKVPLAELPALLAGCSLFLGNDSGPKHIAAGLGVPTVGVHGGTVDVREWGPVGPAAVAVAREVVCSPCYLSRVEDCRRGLACLRQLSPDAVYAACKRLLPLAAARSPQKGVGAAAPARRASRSRGSAAALAEADPR